MTNKKENGKLNECKKDLKSHQDYEKNAAKLLEQYTREKNELTELLKRNQANFENYKKQTESRVQEIRDMAAKDVILQILPIVDNFQLALKSTPQHTSEFAKGIELIYSQLFSVLENNDVKIIETEKKDFDPYLHEALMKVDSELPENRIVEELQKGFTLQGKVIRHAKVKISTGKPVKNDN